MTNIIAGDIGGTKTLLRCVDSSDAVAAEKRFDSGHYATFDDLLREFLPLCPGAIDAACFAVAGPVITGRAEVTNLKWVMESARLSATPGPRSCSTVCGPGSGASTGAAWWCWVT